MRGTDPPADARGQVMRKADASVVVILVRNLRCKRFWGLKGPVVAFKTVLEPEVPLQRGT